MSQQQQSQRGTHQGGTGQATGQQYDEYQQLIPQSGFEFDEDLTSELRVAIHDLEDVSRKTKWCIDSMIDEGPRMSSCVRACRDVGRLADTTVDYIASDSIYTIEGALFFLTVAEDAIQEIERHQQPHCQETADAVGRAIDSMWGVLESFVDPQTLQGIHQQTRQLKQQATQSQELPHAMGGQQATQGGGMAQGGGQMTQGSQQPTQGSRKPAPGSQQMGGGQQMRGGQSMQGGGKQPPMQQGGQQPTGGSQQMHGGRSTGGQFQGPQTQGF